MVAAAKKPKAAAVKKSKPLHPLMIDSKSWNRPMVMAILCERISVSTESVRTLLAKGFQGNILPQYSAIKDWLIEEPELAAQYARAKEAQAEFFGEELLEIADDGSNDWMMSNSRDNPGWVANGEHLQRSRLRVDTRKWLMSKLLPKKYGDKVEHDVKGTMTVVISKDDAGVL